GVKSGQNITIHAVTAGEQQPFTATGNERAISGLLTMLQTSTGFKSAIPATVPAAGPQDGFALRIPTGDGSLLSSVIELEHEISQEELENAFAQAAEGRLKGVLTVRKAYKTVGTTIAIGDTHNSLVVEMTVVAGKNGKGSLVAVQT